MFVEFENIFLIEGIFLISGHGANVLVEFKMFFFNWGHFFKIGGKCVS